MLSDLRLAFRSLSKTPGFTLVALLTLSLGLGVNIALFGMVNFMFLRSSSVREPERLVYLNRNDPNLKFWMGLSYADYLEFKKHDKVFEDLIALNFTAAHLGLPGRNPERRWIEAVSGNYFSALGVQAQLGRLFLPGEGEKPGADPLVIVSYDYWKNTLGSDPSVIGRSLFLNGRPLTLIGVLPADFHSVQWALAPSAFIPASQFPSVFTDSSEILSNHNWNSFKVLGHIQKSLSLDQARTAVALVGQQIETQFHPGASEIHYSLSLEKRARPDPGVAGFLPMIIGAFLGMVLLVLVIAGSNVSNLMASRNLARQRELGIRSAVGASRWHLIRLLLVESTLLALGAGLLALLLSMWTGPLLARFAPQSDFPTFQDTSFDPNSIWFTLGASLLAGLFTGLPAAFRATSFSVQDVLRGSGPALGSVRSFSRDFFVITQICSCVVVLVCGGLFLRSLQKLSYGNLGFRRANLTIASVDWKLHGYSQDKARQFLSETTEAIRQMPYVKNVSFATHIPFSHAYESKKATVEGALPARSSTPGASEPGDLMVGINRVGTDFVRTMGVSLLQGRDFSKHDSASSSKVALINLSLARKLWSSTEVLGKRFRLDGGEPIEVVGLVGDGKYFMLSDSDRPFCFLPFEQAPAAPVTFLVHSTSSSDYLAPLLRNLISTRDTTLPLYYLRSMEEHALSSALGFMPLRLGAVFAGAQGLLGLILAVMGIYGVVSYLVGLRTREIGIRIALGAKNKAVLSLVIGGNMRLTLIGLILGLLLAVGVAQGLTGLLYGLNPFDPWVFVFVVVLILGVSLLACYLPARRATRINPIQALRND